MAVSIKTWQPYDTRIARRVILAWMLLGVGMAIAVIYGLTNAGSAVGTVGPVVAGIIVSAVIVGTVVTGISFHLWRRRAIASLDATVRSQTPSDGVSTSFQNVIDSISDGFVLWGPDDRLVTFNRRAREYHTGHIDLRPGISFKDYVVATYGSLDDHHRESGGDLTSWLVKRADWHDQAMGTHEIRMNSGRWVLLTERRTECGATASLYTDITDQKRAEEHALRGERRFAHAQQLARIGVWEWELNTNETYWSDTMYDILDISPQFGPLSLDQYMLLVHPNNRDLVSSTVKRLVTTGGQYHQEYQIVTPKGDTRFVRSESQAVLDKDGKPVRVVGSMHDVTQLKRTERALRRAKEAADHANRAKSEFLANVSHELRTPLNAIIGFSEVMIQEVFGPIQNERYHEYAGDIRQSGAHLLAVINDLLDYSKFEAGRLELHLEEMSIEKVVEKCVRLMREHAQTHDVTIVTSPIELPTTIEADERKVTQILLNLISNAVKFTPKGGVVTVSADGTATGAELRVIDTGIGMSEQDIQQALSPFGQVDSSINRQHTGTGLGLPLTRALTELHGGSMDIESAPGAGTTIRIRLPKTPPEKPESAASPTLRVVSGGQAD